MNYYRVLEVSETATDKEIKKSYKKLVKKYHPDVFDGDKSVAEIKIKELNEAYEVLSNADSRKNYDNSLNQINVSDIENDFESRVQNQESDFSSQDLRARYERFYASDYSKKYTTNYYGVSRNDLKNEKNKYSNNSVWIEVSKSKALVIVGCALLISAIILIILLSLLRDLLENSSSFDSDKEVSNTASSFDYSAHRWGYIDLDMTYNEVLDSIGSPDYIESANIGYYGYWGDSYIAFNSNNIVVDWQNNGDFYTYTPTGSDAKYLRQYYNSILE